MNFNQLELTIQNLVGNVVDNFSIFIRTEAGDIAINAYEPRKAASVIKVPILVEAFRQIENKSLHPDALVYITEDMKVDGAGVINYLTNSNVYSYRNLLELMIIVSDNTAANVILDKIDIDNVNDLAIRLGCRHTNLARKFMDFDAQHAGLDNYTSAFDMLHYLQLVAEPNDIINEESRKQILNILFHQQFNDKLPGYVNEYDEVIFYHKTGELPGVEHDVAILNRDEKNVLAVVLSQGWVNNGIGKRYIAEIGNYLTEYMKS